jgi:hypothetical protein
MRDRIAGYVRCKEYVISVCSFCSVFRVPTIESPAAVELWINLRPDDILGYRDDPFGWDDVLTVIAM